MGQSVSPLLPGVQRLLADMGMNIRLARRRRGLLTRQVAERAGMSLPTLRSIERGYPGATMGAYAAVLQVLGLEKDLALLAQSDPLGRRLQDARLEPKRETSAGR